jgi:hypothetical protein
MNLQKESQLGAHAVMWAVTNKRQEVEELAKRNGIKFSYMTPNGMVQYDDTMTAQSLISYMRKSPRIKKDFIAMMAQYPQWATSYMSMNGEFANVSGGVADTSLNLTTAIGTDTTPKKTWFTADNIQGTLNTALNAFLTLDKNKTDRALAGSASDVAKYNASIDKDSEGNPKDDTKSNTTLYVVLGVVGVVLLGGLIFVATKKR